MKEEKRSELIQDALQFLDDEMIEEVEKLRSAAKKNELHDMSNDKNTTEIYEKRTENEAVGMNICNTKDVNVKKDTEWKENAYTTRERVSKRKSAYKKGIALAASICVLIAGSWIFANYIHPADNGHNLNDKSQSGDMEIDTVGNDKTEDSSVENDITNNGENSHVKENNEESNRLEQYSQQDISDDAYVREEAAGIETESSIDDMESQIHLPMAELPNENKKGVTIPKMEVYLGNTEELAADMIAFFIHNGRCYVQYDLVKNGADFVGKRVGTIRGMIDEWTPEDGYVDGAGSVTGDIYEVEGVSPDFMLCMVWDDGVVETYINNNGISLEKGSDLVDDRLHLRANFETVSFQTDKEYSHTQKAPNELPEDTKKLFQQFLDSFAEHEFVYMEGKSYYPYGGNTDNSHIYHLYFTTENGLVIRFSLMGDGYVCFPWINGVCVQIEREIYDEVVQLLQGYVE